MSRKRFPEAIALSQQAINLAGESYPEVQIAGTYTLGLAKARSGNGKEGLRLCDEAVKMASTTRDFSLQSRALLAKAEAALIGNDAQTALSLAMDGQAKFAPNEQFESEWRAWLIASRASAKLGDKNKAQELATNAANARSKLEQQWGSEAFRQYTLRPDIQAYYQ